MVEGGENMPKPEQELGKPGAGPITPESTPAITPESTPEEKFHQNVMALLERKTDKEGKEIKGSAVIENKRLRVWAVASLAPKANLEEICEKAAAYLESKLELHEAGKLSEEDYDRLETQVLALQTVLGEEALRRNKKNRVLEELEKWTSEVQKGREGGGSVREKEKEEGEEEKERERPREALLGQNIEPYLGAVFEKGRYESYIRTGQISRETNVVLDATKKRDRERWLLENVRAAMDGTIPNPEETWKSIVDFWRLDFSEAARRRGLSVKEKEDFDEEIRAVMAVCASARAMEQSDGSAATYIGFITQSSPDHPYLDRKDDWAEYLLHGDESKLRRVLENPLVNYYYQELIESAGIRMVWRKGKEEIPIKNMSKEEAKKRGYEEDFKVDRSVFIEGEKEVGGKKQYVFKPGTIAYYLREGNGGMKRFIHEVLLNKDVGSLGEYEESERWAAARMACDAFLVDKYTRWEYKLNEEENGEIGEKGGILKPSSSWGGDPLRALLEPSFLPRRIKGVYRGEGDSVVLDLVDESFRGVVEKFGVKPLEASMVVDLKAYARWNEALWTFFGGSRAPRISQWTDKVMYEDLPKIAELLDQVYGGKSKELVGTMIAKIIKTKALASAMTSARIGFKEAVKIIFGEQTTEAARPFLKVEQFIWGPERDARRGFLADLASGRTRFVFGNDAKVDLNEAAEILFSCDQTKSGRRKAKALNTLGFFLDVLAALSRGGKSK